MRPLTLHGAIAEIEACGFECEAGPLANSGAWRWLKEHAADRQAIVENVSRFVERVEDDRRQVHRKPNQADVEAIRAIGRKIAMEEL